MCIIQILIHKRNKKSQQTWLKMKSPSIRLPRKRMHATWHCQHSLSEKLTNRIVLFEKIRNLGRYKDRSEKKETNKNLHNF